MERALSFAAPGNHRKRRMSQDPRDTDTTIDVVHLARLARLRLDADAEALARTDLANIIRMIDTMQAMDTEGVAPMANPLDATQRLRSDAVTETVDREVFQAGAPAADSGYYLVPRVVE